MSSRFAQVAFRTVVLALAGALAVPAAQASRTGVDFHFGTLGLGLGIDAQVSPYTGFRFGFNRFKTSSDWEEDDLDYEAGIDFDTVHGLLDWHPFGGKFRLTGGVMATDHRIDAAADVEIGDEIGDGQASRNGRLEAEVKFEEWTPYIGTGWDWRFDRSNLEMTLDLGVLARGDPDVELRETSDTGASQQDLNEAEDEIEDEWSDYNLYPVVQFGLLYRF
ncbi:autotransporter outer membrane beta-barrel domain-containing protein [Halofilum ochraceum]|uniref:autotransporter outer membrane beta-barrel domain-containing protein n=1 Tax=Halofilum ochraceum TaxID=1611323 RepID=UPI0008DA2305|nr:autotransporter outer membrane beta-barrel domain-containing protein [Halofilum ochraceum]